MGLLQPILEMPEMTHRVQWDRIEFLCGSLGRNLWKSKVPTAAGCSVFVRSFDVHLHCTKAEGETGLINIFAKWITLSHHPVMHSWKVLMAEQKLTEMAKKSNWYSEMKP